MKYTLSFLLSLMLVPALAQDNSYHVDKDYAIKPEGTLKLSVSDARVFITGSNRSTAHVKIDREVTTKGLTFGHDHFSVDILEEGGDLTVRETSGSSTMGIVGYYSEKYEVTIEVPKGVSLKIKGDDGDYHITYLNGAIAIDLDDADIEVLGCGGTHFEFTLDDGDIRMDQGKGSLVLNADDADVKIAGASFSSIDAEVDDGDFVVETSLDDAGHYNVRAQDGLVSMKITGGGGKFQVRHDDARVVAEGPFQELEKSDDRTTLQLQGGNATVEIRANDGRVRLAAK